MKEGEAALCTGLVDTFSGNHQRCVLKIFIKSKANRVKALRAEVRHLTSDPNGEIDMTSQEYKNFQEKEQLLKKLEDQLDSYTHWGD